MKKGHCARLDALNDAGKNGRSKSSPMNADVRPAPTRTGFPLTPVFLGLTAILVGYFLVWLPGPSAGLRLIGIELGEWIKFLGVGSRRDLFYLPPIVVGLVLGLVAATWPNDRPQTWLARALAVVDKHARRVAQITAGLLTGSGAAFGERRNGGWRLRWKRRKQPIARCVAGHY